MCVCVCVSERVRLNLSNATSLFSFAPTNPNCPLPSLILLAEITHTSRARRARRARLSCARSQYNSFSLAFVVWAVVALHRGNDVIASVMFSLSLNYKQMSLYFALPFFAVLLGRCIARGRGRVGPTIAGIYINMSYAMRFPSYPVTLYPVTLYTVPKYKALI